MFQQGFTDAALPDLRGKRFLVTGANAGLGLETARALGRGGADVVLLCRDTSRGEAARRDVTESAGRGELWASLAALDLADLASVAAFAERELANEEPVTGLVCNAGLMAVPEAKTKDGFEMQMGVNHLGHFALVGRLLPKLKASRVVVVSSTYHKGGRLDWLDDLNFERRPYHRWHAYMQSKLANMLFMAELGRRAARAGLGLVATGAHPGYAATELQGRGAKSGGPKWEGLAMRVGNSLVAQSARAGAWPQLAAAVDANAHSGDYYGPSFFELRGPAVKVAPSRAARDEAAAAALWKRSEALTGVAYLD